MNNFYRCAQALTNGNRVKMLKLLTEKDICVCEMKKIFQISPSQVSRDLKTLYDSGFLKRWNEGKCVVYMADRIGSEPYCRAMLDLVANSFNDDESIGIYREKLQQAIMDQVREKSR
ncbi:ArsR/SmtB family transcription factor [Chloroflexota bacterium]